MSLCDVFSAACGLWAIVMASVHPDTYNIFRYHERTLSLSSLCDIMKVVWCSWSFVVSSMTRDKGYQN